MKCETLHKKRSPQDSVSSLPTLVPVLFARVCASMFSTATLVPMYKIVRLYIDNPINVFVCAYMSDVGCSILYILYVYVVRKEYTKSSI